MQGFPKNIVRCIAFMRKSPRYGAIAGVFLLAIYYNSVIALPPESPQDSKEQDQIVTKKVVFADIDLDHPAKKYEHVLLSQKGDWYRIGLVARSLGGDESLKVSLVSSVGKVQEVGVADIKKGDGEKYFEFIVASNGSYEDVIVSKAVDESDKGMWPDEGVRLGDMFVSRLNIADATEEKSLQRTVFGAKDVQVILTQGINVTSGINLPHNAHFIQGQIFDVFGDRYLLSSNIRVKQNGATGTGKYRLELRSYDVQSKKVGDQVLQRIAFSAKDLKNIMDNDGSYRLNIPFALKKGQSYFLGVSDDYVKSAKKIQLESFRDNGVDPLDFRYFSLSTVDMSGVQNEKNMMTHAVIEDLGLMLQYRYRSSHTVTDVMDMFESSDKVSFDDELGAIVGKEEIGTFFTYKIDTRQPFTDLQMKATQLGDDSNQIRLEYSFDNAFWKEISATQVDASSKRFDMALHNVAKDTSTMYVRVSYIGSKNSSGVFGLSDFRVTATMPKNAVKKLVY